MDRKRQTKEFKRNGRAAWLAACVVLLATAGWGPVPAEAQEAPESLRLAETGGAKPEPKRADLAETAPNACVIRYHEDLMSIAAQTPAAVSAGAPVPEGEGFDARLPGILIIPPQPRQRTRAEIAVLNVASALARSQGRSASSLVGVSSDKTWIAERLRGDLSDYLKQKPSPYLCDGVEPYLATLASYAEQLGPSPERRTGRIETARASANKALSEAMAAIDALTPSPVTDLRPAAGIERTEIAQSEPKSEETADRPADLASEAGRAAAIDALIAKAEAKGVFASAGDRVTIVGATTVDELPVLSRLAAIKPALLGPRVVTPIDRKLSRSLATALSEIELLDYIERAGAGEPDPVSGQIHATLAAIRDAHRRDCTCAP